MDNGGRGGRIMIIALSGKIGTGKSTLAALLIERLGASYERHAFADCLKEEAAATFGFPLEWAYSEDGKGRIAHTPDQPQSRAVVWPAGAGFGLEHAQDVPERPMTVRAILQWYGTDVCRKADPRYWDKRMAERIEGKPNVIVDDVRFPSEVELLRSLGALLVRLDPYPGWVPDRHSGHESETALDGYTDWDMRLITEFGRLSDAADEVVLYMSLSQWPSGGPRARSGLRGSLGSRTQNNAVLTPVEGSCE